MDPTSIWADLYKLGPVFAIMGAIILYLVRDNNALKSENKTLQQDKLDLTRSSVELVNVVNKHTEAGNDMLKNIPVLFAQMQEKLVEAIRNEFRGKV